MSDIVVHCPNEKAHVVPKILFAYVDGAQGKFHIQCRDPKCRRISKNRGWYEITLDKTTGCSVRPVKKDHHFDFSLPPYVVLEASDGSNERSSK